MSAEVAILIPAMRPHRLVALIRNIGEATPEPHYIYLQGTADVLECLADSDVKCFTDKGGTWGKRLTAMYRKTKEPYLFLGADDVRFQRGWFTEARAAMQQVDGVVSVADRQSHTGTLALVSRRYLDEESGCVDVPRVVIHPKYHHNFSERELFETAAYRGRYAYCPSSVVEHLHHLSGRAPSDEVYVLGASRWDKDSELFESRRHLWNGAEIRLHEHVAHRPGRAW